MIPVDALRVTQAIRRAAVAATLAPSVDNTQPWRFVLGPSSLEIHAAWERRLPALDPRGRQLLISCGGAVLNARVSLAAAGYDTDDDLFPDPARPGLLARLRVLGPGAGESALGELHPAVGVRRTNRLPFHDEPPPDGVVDAMLQAAGAEGTELIVLSRAEDRSVVARLSAQAQAENGTPGEPELQLDTRSEENQVLLLLGTREDTPRAWLDVGQSLQRVVLEATRHDLGVSLLARVVEVARTNAGLRGELQLAVHPQMLLRAGRVAATPASRRRRFADMIEIAG